MTGHLESFREFMKKCATPAKFAVTLATLLGVILTAIFYHDVRWTSSVKQSRGGNEALPTIVVVTPTHRRATRLADLTRLSNTLRLVPNAFWLVIEDGNQRVPAVEKLLNVSSIPYKYLPRKTVFGYPKRGWYQRDSAITYLRENSREIFGSKKGVVYFADDDNSYDTRLFTDYISKVTKVGVWAVGFAGNSPVDSSPKVVNGTVVGWESGWGGQRKFAVDMAAFAVHTDILLKSDALFGTECQKGQGSPETCFLERLGVKLEDLEPFGVEQENGRELLAWHTKTVPFDYDKRTADLYGYFVE